MGRSLKKGPFVDTHLLEKIEVMNRAARPRLDDGELHGSAITVSKIEMP